MPHGLRLVTIACRKLILLVALSRTEGGVTQRCSIVTNSNYEVSGLGLATRVHFFTVSTVIISLKFMYEFMKNNGLIRL